MTTLAQINKVLATLTTSEVELVKGKGYFYFAGIETNGWNDCSVLVNTVNQLTLDQWIAEYNAKKEIAGDLTESVFYVPNKAKFHASIAKIQAAIAKRNE